MSHEVSQFSSNFWKEVMTLGSVTNVRSLIGHKLNGFPTVTSLSDE